MPKVIYLEPMPWTDENAQIEDAIDKYQDDGTTYVDWVPDQNSGPYEMYPGDVSNIDDIDDATAALFLGMLFIVATLIVALIFISVMFFV